MKALTCVVALGLVACGEDPPEMTGGLGETPGGEAVGCADLTRTCAEVLATFRGADGVEVACDEGAGEFEVTSTGVPEWDPEAQGETTPNTAEEKDYRARFPLSPKCAAETVDTGNTRGPIGMMIDGVVFYGREDATGGDAYINESDTFDACAGHADMDGRYHYHSEPTCVFGLGVALSSRNAADGHAPVVGYGLDGFALYADTTIADEPALDACNGHFSEARGYHYHTSGTTSPYLAGCYAGEITGGITN